jgi:hypothetical protein
MSVTFDASTGHLRLDADAFIALAECASDPRGACEEVLEGLVEAGAVTDGAPHPALRDALAAVTSSSGSLQVLVTGPDGARLHQGWLAPVSALLTDLADGTYELGSAPMEFLPTAVARFTGLRPRPRLLQATAVVDESVLDDLASNAATARDAGGEALADLLAPWPAAAASVRAGGWRLSVVDVAFPTPVRTVARRLAWVDTDAGALRVEVDRHGPVLAPATSSELWRAVVAILPTDAETGLVARSA